MNRTIATTAGARPLAGLLRSALSRITAAYRLRADRRDILRLADLDDRILDDIGVTRAEVHAVCELPLGTNAALALRRMASERRARQARRHRLG